MDRCREISFAVLKREISAAEDKREGFGGEADRGILDV
jgi:hypothetical protein